MRRSHRKLVVVARVTDADGVAATAVRRIRRER
jgi:hypothetical protein